MKKIKKTKTTQQRYEKHYVQSKSVSAAISLIAGDIQLQNLKKLTKDIERIEKILERVA